MRRIGYGQVEPNHLSAKRTGQIYAQLPADSSITILQNGMFAKYDYAAGKVNFTGEGEWMLVLNEVKLYDEDWRYYGDHNGLYSAYAMKKTDFVDGEMVPRLFKTNVGDIFTTNCFGYSATGLEGVAAITFDFAEGDHLAPGKNGFLEKTDATEGMLWKVVKLTTMPDGQDGVKLQRIQ